MSLIPIPFKLAPVALAIGLGACSESRGPEGFPRALLALGASESMAAPARGVILTGGPAAPAPNNAALCGALQDPLQNLTMSAAITRATCSNPRLTDAMLAVNLERNQRTAAFNQFLPSISASTQYGKNNNRSLSMFGPNNDGSQGASRSLAINWLLVDFGARTAQLEASEQTALAAMASENAVLQETIAAVAEAYLNILTLKDLKHAAQTATAAAREAVAIAKAKSAGGVATQVEVEFALLNAQQQQLTMRQIEGQIRVATGDLAILMNLNPDTPLKVAQPQQTSANEDVDARLSGKIADLLRQIEAHPEIRAADARAAAADRQIDAARRDLLPKVSAVGAFSADGRPGQSVSPAGTRERFVGLSITAPLTSPFTDSHRVTAARLQRDRAQVQAQETRNRVEGAIWRAYQSLETSRAVVATARTAERHAASAAAQARTKYQHGGADISEWLRAQKATADARGELIRARGNVRIARVKLLLSLGRLGAWRLDRNALEARMANLTRGAQQR